MLREFDLEESIITAIVHDDEGIERDIIEMTLMEFCDTYIESAEPYEMLSFIHALLHTVDASAPFIDVNFMQDDKVFCFKMKLTQVNYMSDRDFS